MNRRIAVLAAVGVLGAAGGGAWLLFHRQSANPLRHLASTGVVRAFPARLSIAVEHRPCAPASAQGDDIVPREVCGTNGVPFDANGFAAESTDPDSLQTSALVEVIWRDAAGSRLDDAISRLDRARRLSAEPVPLLVDLAAAHLVRAEQTQNSRDLVQALDYAQEALEKDPGNLPARFNSALALQALGVDGQARLAWDRYLAADSNSPWAAEARHRRGKILPPRAPLAIPSAGAPEAVVRAFGKAHPQEARELGWDSALGAWGAAVIRQDGAEAERYLTLAGQLGNALEQSGGDRSLADAVRNIRAAHDTRATRVLARAHLDYAAGMDLWKKNRHEAASETFARVSQWAPASAVLVQWAAAEGIASLGYSHSDSADREFDRLRPNVDSVRYPALVARLDWAAGTRGLRKDSLAEPQSRYAAAARRFQQIGETENAGIVVGMAGEVAYARADTLTAYQFMHRGLLALRRDGGSIWLHGRLLTLAHNAAGDGMPRAAALIQNEDVRIGLASPDPTVRMEALLARARLRAEAGHLRDAARDYAAAEPLVDRLPPGDARAWFEENQRSTRVLITPSKVRPDTALDSAIEFFKHKDVVLLLPLLARRADDRLAHGDADGAVADLDTITTRIRSLSRREQNSWLRAGMVERARSQFDRLVILHWRAGRVADALMALERGRLSFGPTGTARPLGREMPAAPRGQVAVEYALIGDTLLTWTVRGRDVVLDTQTVKRNDFLRTVDSVSAAMETPARSEQVQSELAHLYDWLVRPVASRLGPPETPLVILADGEVAGVPFAAVYDTATDRYLVQDHSLRSASTLADAARTAPAFVAPITALLVAPTFDAASYPGLPSLPGALAEVNSLALIYGWHRPLTGLDATPAAFTQQAREAMVVHYAGHALFDDGQPEQSYLLLAGAGLSGRLSADSISRLDLGRVRLVVLSACRTLRSRSGRSGGFAGLSGALLVAGAGGVVGSVWDVRDRLAQPLMGAFHREYLRSGNAAEALRQAQLQQLKSHDPELSSPAAWAGFRYAGW